MMSIVERERRREREGGERGRERERVCYHMFKIILSKTAFIENKKTSN